MGVPNLEKAPSIAEPWLGLWRVSLAEMKATDTWKTHLRPLLDRYVEGLRLASEHRAVAEVSPFTHSERTERDYIHPGFASADREEKRAVMIAGALGLTPKALKDLGALEGSDGDDDESLAAFDELAARRQTAG